MALFNDDSMNPDAIIDSNPQWLAFSKYFKAPVNKMQWMLGIYSEHGIVEIDG
jgi:hypothetical protein